MRILFMGTSSFAVPSLESLVSAGYEVALVVTQPDRPSGRGRTVHTSPVKQAAERLGLPVFQPEKIREQSAVDTVRACAPIDAIVVAAFGQIIPQSILDIPKYGSINVHASLLPRYRGAAPIQYAVMSGEAVTGVTTMMMDAGLDTGDILLTREVEIGLDETAGELEVRLAAVGSDLLIETLDLLERGRIHPVPQDSSQATLVRPIKREQGKIDWTRSAVEVVNLVRAFTPRPGAYTSLNEAQIKVTNARAGMQSVEGMAPGMVVEVTRNDIVVATGEGTVRLIEIQPENRRRMSAGEFARGARISPGSRFD